MIPGNHVVQPGLRLERGSGTRDLGCATRPTGNCGRGPSPAAIAIRPDTGVFDLQMKKLPALASGNSNCERVAGARFEPLQMEMRPVERFSAVVGGRLRGAARRTSPRSVSLRRCSRS